MWFEVRGEIIILIPVYIYIYPLYRSYQYKPKPGTTPGRNYEGKRATVEGVLKRTVPHILKHNPAT
jgi:hypothetical protein